MAAQVKICGLRDPLALNAAITGGAAFVGFVFFPRSPRNVSLTEAAALTRIVPPHILRVGLVVDASDDLLQDIVSNVPLDVLQLHGHETPSRVAETKALTNKKLIKAIGISVSDDINHANDYAALVDWLLFDAKPTLEQTRPGGNAKTFDWSLLTGRTPVKPWMLAGGLNVNNLADAVRVSRAPIIDVSSGVEDSPGHKNPEKIRHFLELASLS